MLSNHYKFSVAPMLKLTDRHCRFFFRQMTSCALLYTEMITTNSILYGKRDYLSYNDFERPLSLQLGGNDPKDLGYCAKIAQERGYDEVNLNIGCPSNRAKNGYFGAILMSDKERVAECILSMQESVSIPVTVKTRIGIDERYSYSFLYDFINTVYTKGGCKTFIIHARKAFLNGCTPKKNLNIPELNYNIVYKIKKDFPNIKVIINGGINTIEESKNHLKKTDGVMLGRVIYKNPSILMNIDKELFNNSNFISNKESVIHAMIPYIKKELYYGTPCYNITRHMLGFFQGVPGASKWRRCLSKDSDDLGPNVLLKALSFIQN